MIRASGATTAAPGAFNGIPRRVASVTEDGSTLETPSALPFSAAAFLCAKNATLVQTVPGMIRASGATTAAPGAFNGIPRRVASVTEDGSTLETPSALPFSAAAFLCAKNATLVQTVPGMIRASGATTAAQETPNGIPRRVASVTEDGSTPTVIPSARWVAMSAHTRHRAAAASAAAASVGRASTSAPASVVLVALANNECRHD